MKQRHLRPGDRLGDDDLIVVRGGRLDQVLLRDDAIRYFSIYGTYGVSVFATRQTPLRNWPRSRRWSGSRFLP
ncbi:MAG: hypothetical protein ACYC1D_05825 [Acidimicrobiales bacterium]